MLLGVAAGLFFFVLATYCGIVIFERIAPSWRQETLPVLAFAIALPLVGVALLGIWLVENLSLNTGRWSVWLERQGRRLTTSFLLAVGALFLSCGLSIISESLPTGTMLALIAGPTFLGTAFLALRDHRRWRQWLLDHNHRGLALLYLPAISILVTAGGLILGFGL